MGDKEQPPRPLRHKGSGMTGRTASTASNLNPPQNLAPGRSTAQPRGAGTHSSMANPYAAPPASNQEQQRQSTLRDHQPYHPTPESGLMNFAGDKGAKTGGADPTYRPLSRTTGMWGPQTGK